MQELDQRGATAKSHRRAKGKRLVAMAMVASAVLPMAALAQSDNDAPLVQTVEGPVRGTVEGGVQSYLGIPYAAPPVGALRWRPPQPVEGWQEPLQATSFGNTCPQVTTLGTFAGPMSTTEDCLYLNVFTTGRAAEGEPRPVLVWIHGGGNFDGESNDYDASKLATGGPEGVPTVVVTFNYRLNLFGTLLHPALNGPDNPSGNYGTMDQQAVLEWIQRNIAAFGGDLGRVTVGGQSAGSYNTGAQVLSPRSAGMIDRAIFMSSPAFSYYFPTAEQVESKGKAFAEAAGCPGTDAATAACLRGLSAAHIVQLAGTPEAVSPYVSNMPYIDGAILPHQPLDAWESGEFNRVPIIGGATKDEFTFFTGVAQYYNGARQAPMTESEFARATAPDAFCLWCRDFRMPRDVALRYAPSGYGGDVTLALQRLNTDIAKCRELRVMNAMARWVPTFAYDFVYEDAPFYFPRMEDFRADATHTVDIQFLFPGYHGGPIGVNIDQETGQPREMNEEESRLADQMVAAWTRFAASGDPNPEGSTVWPRYSDAGGEYLVKDLTLSTVSVSQFRQSYQCDYWDSRLP